MLVGLWNQLLLPQLSWSSFRLAAVVVSWQFGTRLIDLLSDSPQNTIRKLGVWNKKKINLKTFITIYMSVLNIGVRKLIFLQYLLRFCWNVKNSVNCQKICREKSRLVEKIERNTGEIIAQLIFIDASQYQNKFKKTILGNDGLSEKLLCKSWNCHFVYNFIIFGSFFHCLINFIILSYKTWINAGQ